MAVKWLRVLLLALALTTVKAWAGSVEDWTSTASGNTGSFADDKGSKISFEVVDGAKSGEKAFLIDANEVQGGYCGIWHNVDVNISKATALKFMAKADPPGSLSFSITDANKVQYVTTVNIASKDWAEVTVPISSFEQNKYYQPEGADKTKPMDFSHVPGMGFGPAGVGAQKIWLGVITPVEAEAKSEAKSDGGKKAKGDDKKGASKKVEVVLQDFDVDDPGLGGVWKDDKGTTIELTYKAAKKKDKPEDRMAVLKYNLTAGGWCGMWYRAGSTWDGVDCTGATAIVAKVYTEKPMEIGFSSEDANKVKLDTASPTTTGGRWETVTFPLDNMPKEFGLLKTFNIYMKTPGENVLSIDTITLVK
jgi:hypothetical protein